VVKMVSSEVVLQTIRRMISSGVDDNTIRITLKGIGLPDPQIDSLIRDAKAGTPVQGARAQETNEEASGEQEESAGDEAAGDEDIDYEGDAEAGAEEGEEGDVKSEIASSSQEQLANHTTTHNILEQHSSKMDQVRADVSALHEKFDSSPKISGEQMAKLGALDVRISSLEREVSETKANTIALQELLKKILETDRKTLLELQKK